MNLKKEKNCNFCLTIKTEVYMSVNVCQKISKKLKKCQSVVLKNAFAEQKEMYCI